YSDDQAPRGARWRAFYATCLSVTPDTTIGLLERPKLLGDATLGLLGAITRTALATGFHTARVELTANNAIANTRQILNATTLHQHRTVLLQIVSLARDVSCHFDIVTQAHTGNLTQRRVRLLGGRRAHTGTN